MPCIITQIVKQHEENGNLNKEPHKLEQIQEINTYNFKDENTWALISTLLWPKFEKKCDHKDAGSKQEKKKITGVLNLVTLNEGKIKPSQCKKGTHNICYCKP